MRLNIKASQETHDRREIKGDVLLQRLATKRPAQIEAYIEANVTNLQSAKAVIKTLAKAVALLARKELGL